MHGDASLFHLRGTTLTHKYRATACPFFAGGGRSAGAARLVVRRAPVRAADARAVARGFARCWGTSFATQPSLCRAGPDG